VSAINYKSPAKCNAQLVQCSDYSWHLSIKWLITLSKFNSLVLMDKYLLAAALLATLITIHTAKVYLDTYRMVMQTDISASIKEVRFEEGRLVLSILISIQGRGKPFTPERLRYDVWLNGKYMTSDLIEGLPVITPGEKIELTRILKVPGERMFTVEEAIRSNSWAWKISGSILVQTFYGETLIRFEGSAILPPQGIQRKLHPPGDTTSILNAFSIPT